METISFLLGVAAVITLVIVAVTFMNYVTIKNLIKDIKNLEYFISLFQIINLTGSENN